MDNIARQALLGEIVGWFESGELQRAEDACRNLVLADPSDALTTYLLAQILNRNGKRDQALPLMQLLTRAFPDEARYHNDYGVMLGAGGRWPEAEAAYRQALALDPANDDAVFNLALAVFKQKRLDEARAELDRVAPRLQDAADFQALDGELKRAEGRPEAAVAAFERAIALGRTTSDVYMNLGLALEDLGQGEAAIDSLQRATALDPDDAAACFHLANYYRDRDRLDLAAEYYRRAVALRPDLAEAHNNLGLVLQSNDEAERAAACFERAVDADPDLDAAHTNLGCAQMKQGWMEGAIASFQRALEINPGSAEAWNNLGNVYFRLHRLDEARAAYRRSLELKPDYVEADLNLGILLLLEGQLAEGWQRYESRWAMPGVAEKRPQFAQPEWDGSPLAGRALLVYSEQGMGDNLHFARYLPLLRQRYPQAKIYFWCLAPLYRLFDACAADWGIEALAPVLPQGLPAFDVQVALLSLPKLLGTVLETIPGEVPYIAAPAELAQHWRQRLAALPGPRVGLVWASGEVYAFHKTRTVRLRQLKPLLDVPGVSWVSLQKGNGARQIGEEGLGGRIADFMDDVEDFADTAAIIANLDLVISVDTSVPHLAGAMGKPVWLLDRFDTDWRWLLDRSDSPWYPTMRIFRQARLGEWPPVMAAAATALAAWTGAGAPAAPVAQAARAVAAAPKLKLNLGCGSRKAEGWLNVDCVDACAPDLVLDLESTPWPWADGAVEAVQLVHVLEHLGQTSAGFLAIVKELWRVCCDGARIDIVVPHPRSDFYLGDPTHVRPVLPAMLDLFNQRLNREWATMGASNTPLGQILGVDFEVENATYDLAPRWREMVARGQISEPDLWLAIQERNNVVEQIRIVWRVRKQLA